MNPQTEITPLPFRQVVRITCKGIRIRIWRSLIVVSSIVLAVAFLCYILCSDSFVQNVVQLGAPDLLERLRRAGMNFDDLDNQRIQTYWMVGLAMMISFVGIVNAMLMSVTERFREIGTMKCLGALDSFVMNSFLVESVIEGSAGSLAGVLLGVLLAYAEGLSTYGGAVWGLLPPERLLLILLGAFAAGIVITVLGALYPARQAARMTPVVALRAEL